MTAIKYILKNMLKLAALPVILILRIAIPALSRQSNGSLWRRIRQIMLLFLRQNTRSVISGRQKLCFRLWSFVRTND